MKTNNLTEPDKLIVCIREALEKECRARALDNDDDFEEVIKVIKTTLYKDLSIAPSVGVGLGN
jgi:hypothetical protein